MNKPAFQAIKQYSPNKPVLIFVSSRRQTRLTALDLIGFLAAEENPRQFIRLGEDEIDQLVQSIRDPNLKLTLSFGVGIHHAGLTDKDRSTIDLEMKICSPGCEDVPVTIDPESCGIRAAKWIAVPVGSDCILDVIFTRSIASGSQPSAAQSFSGGARPKHSKSVPAFAESSQAPVSGRLSKSTAYAPRFPKPKDEGWFLTLGLTDQQELLALKRIVIQRNKCSQQLGFSTPERPGRIILSLYFLSDCYVGLDQQ